MESGGCGSLHARQPRPGGNWPEVTTSLIASRVHPTATVWPPSPAVCPSGGQMGSQSHGARWRERTCPRGCLLTVCIKHICCHICWVRRAVGSWFPLSRRAPRGQGWEGRRGGRPGLAPVQASLWRRLKTPQPSRNILCPPAPRSGQAKVGAGVLCLVPCRSPGAPCQQLLLLPHLRPERPLRAYGWGRWPGGRPC